MGLSLFDIINGFILLFSMGLLALNKEGTVNTESYFCSRDFW